MSDMRKKVEDAYATKGDNAEAYLLGVALSLLERADAHDLPAPILRDIEDFCTAIEDHQRAFYDGLPS